MKTIIHLKMLADVGTSGI